MSACWQCQRESQEIIKVSKFRPLGSMNVQNVMATQPIVSVWTKVVDFASLELRCTIKYIIKYHWCYKPLLIGYISCPIQ